MLKEAETQQIALDHRYILKLKEFYLDPHQVCIVTKLMDMDAMHYLSSFPGAIPEEELKDFVHKLVQAVEHCHSRKVIHRDLKLENILLSLSKDGQIVDI